MKKRRTVQPGLGTIRFCGDNGLLTQLNSKEKVRVLTERYNSIMERLATAIDRLRSFSEVSRQAIPLGNMSAKYFQYAAALRDCCRKMHHSHHIQWKKLEKRDHEKILQMRVRVHPERPGEEEDEEESDDEETVNAAYRGEDKEGKKDEDNGYLSSDYDSDKDYNNHDHDAGE